MKMIKVTQCGFVIQLQITKKKLEASNQNCIKSDAIKKRAFKISTCAFAHLRLFWSYIPVRYLYRIPDTYGTIQSYNNNNTSTTANKIKERSEAA